MLREPVAKAAAPLFSVFLNNTAAHPVPVHETDFDEQVGPISVGPGDNVQLLTPIDNSDPGLLQVFGYLVDA